MDIKEDKIYTKSSASSLITAKSSYDDNLDPILDLNADTPDLAKEAVSQWDEFLPEPFAEEGIEKQITSESQGIVFDVETVEMKSSGENSGNYHQQTQTLNRRSDDGYNWRKYGQKQVKGSENRKSYYKCTYLNCPTKKKVEMSLDGQITEIVYKGSHNHPKPQPTRRSSSSSSSALHAIQASNSASTDQSFATHGNRDMDSVATPENSTISIGDEDFDQSSQKSTSAGEDFDEDENDAKRWKKEGENEGLSAPGSRTVREPRVVVQTTSDIDILDDGNKWRKYGQKVVTGNPYPRSYYKCTHLGCPVRKHVERASHDPRAVITTYEGKHNHDVPAARVNVEFEASGQDKKFEIEDIGIERPKTSDIDRSTSSIIQGEAHQLCLMWGGLGLTEMPKEEDWKNVKEIYLMCNELSSLPENPRCPMLLALFLHGNRKLRTIPPSFFDNMPALQILNLSKTGIRSLPESIVRLVNLKRLFLSYCHRFMRLSPKVGELKQLEVLDLEGTDIMDLPKEIKELTDLTCLEVSFCAYLSNVRRAMQSDVVVPCGIISALSYLEELNMSVNPDDKRWSACVEAIVSEVCTLQSLNTLKFYFPRVKLVRQFLLNSPMWVHPPLSNFRFTVGHHVKRTMSRLPSDVEFELERWERCLKYINGVAVPREIQKVLQYSTAFFLERHATIKKLSDFGIGNMRQLKCCVVGECNEVEVIIDETYAHEEDDEVDAHEEGETDAQEKDNEADAHEEDSEADAHEEDDEADAHEEESETNAHEEDSEANAHEENDEVKAYRKDGSNEIVSKTSGAKKIVLGPLEYLYIYYMKNLRRIWKGPVQPKCLSLLKSLTLRTCPQLTTIFTTGLLDNLYNLEELTVEDCPSIKTLVSCKISTEPKTSDFLPNLKRISLHYMPGLVSISSGLHIAPRLEWLSFYNCPNLKHLLIEEVSSKDLKKIKGEWNWWVALKWRSGRPSYLDDIFVPINI